MEYIAIFRSARDVIRCDKQCRAEGLGTKIVAVPEQYSSNCGMSIVVSLQDKNKFTEIINSLELEVKIYEK